MRVNVKLGDVNLMLALMIGIQFQATSICTEASKAGAIVTALCLRCFAKVAFWTHFFLVILFLLGNRYQRTDNFLIFILIIKCSHMLSKILEEINLQVLHKILFQSMYTR